MFQSEKHFSNVFINQLNLLHIARPHMFGKDVGHKCRNFFCKNCKIFKLKFCNKLISNRNKLDVKHKKRFLLFATKYIFRK